MAPESGQAYRLDGHGQDAPPGPAHVPRSVPIPTAATAATGSPLRRPPSLDTVAEGHATPARPRGAPLSSTPGMPRVDSMSVFDDIYGMSLESGGGGELARSLSPERTGAAGEDGHRAMSPAQWELARQRGLLMPSALERQRSKKEAYNEYRQEFKKSRLCTDVLFLCKQGNVKLLQNYCFKKRVDVSDPGLRDYDKRTPLHIAAAVGSYAVAAWLTEMRASVNAVDAFQRTPLEDALRHGHIEVADVLCKAGALLYDEEQDLLVDMHEATTLEKMQWMCGTGTLRWEIPRHEVKVYEKIGKGQFGTVFRGKWRGTEVAVKQFADVNLKDPVALAELRSELGVCKVAHHPHVVQFLGAITTTDGPFSIVSELMAGSLADVMTRAAINPGRVLNARRSGEICLDICRGMAYLHGHKPQSILHRDLKPANLMFTRSGKIKVGDFGLSKTLSAWDRDPNGSLRSRGADEIRTEAYQMTGETGSYRYMAPEVFKHEPYSAKVDVFAFSMIAYQCFTNLQPFCEVDGVTAARQMGIKGMRPMFPGTCPPNNVREVIKDCWRADPKERPTFEEIIERLEPIVNRLRKSKPKGKGGKGQQEEPLMGGFDGCDGTQNCVVM